MSMRNIEQEEEWEGECTYVRQTAKAVLVDYEGEEIWVPKSLLRPGSPTDEDLQMLTEGQDITVVLPVWFAKQEGLV